MTYEETVNLLKECGLDPIFYGLTGVGITCDNIGYTKMNGQLIRLHNADPWQSNWEEEIFTDSENQFILKWVDEARYNLKMTRSYDTLIEEYPTYSKERLDYFVKFQKKRER